MTIALAYLRKNGELYICAESWLKGLGGTPDEPFLSQTIEDNVEVLGNALEMGHQIRITHLVISRIPLRQSR